MNRQQRRAAEKLKGKAPTPSVQAPAKPAFQVVSQQSALDAGAALRQVLAGAQKPAQRLDAPQTSSDPAWPLAAGAAPVKLSICLITYNRARYLRKTLTTFFALANVPFDYELLVCDNCSTDETPAVVAGLMREHSQLRYVRQKKNVGADANLMAAYHTATGEYVVYLADDDQLLPEAVVQVLEYMDRHPDVGVCHCPWELWDDVAQQSFGTFYKVNAPVQFGRQDSLLLCDFVLDNHIFPEISIYRTEVVRRMLYQPRSAFWPFVHLIDALDHAKVAFLPTAYYRSITRHWPGEERQQNGFEVATSDWDSYRGGLEMMIHRSFLIQGAHGVPNEHLRKVADAVQQFVNTRMKVALRLLIGKRDYVAAHAVMVRLLVAGALTPEEAQQVRQTVMARAALQAFLQVFDATTALESVGFYKVSKAEALKILLQELRPELAIVELDCAAGEVEKDRMLVLTGSHENRATLIEAGHHPGFVMVERDLAWMFAS
jgi:glycosyltransferase involved in cell wall biosynthesis